MDDACLQVDRNVSHEYFSSYMKQLNDQIFFFDNILYKKLKIVQNLYTYF